MSSVVGLFCPEISHGSAMVESWTGSEPGHIPRGRSRDRRDAPSKEGPRTEVVLCCLDGRSGRYNGGRHAGVATQPAFSATSVPTPRGFVPVRRGVPENGSDQHARPEPPDGSCRCLQASAEAWKPRSSEATPRSAARCCPSASCVFGRDHMRLARVPLMGEVHTY